jgi:hypothetical protein
MLTLMVFSTARLSAQEDSQAPPAPPEKQEQTSRSEAKIANFYHLDFTLSEVEDGKKTNARTYSMLAQVGTLNKLRVGARVPVVTSSSTMNPSNNFQFQYLDVGMSIDCRPQEQQGLLFLGVTLDSSNFTPPPALSSSAPGQPIIHQMRADVNPLVTPGKPTVIATMDDPSSNRQYRLEVVATKVK